MNFDEVIRPWLLTTAEQWGIRQAHAYRWHDADNKEAEPYFAYTPVIATRHAAAICDRSAKSENTAIHRANQPWITSVRIDLHRSIDGLNELARCCIAAQHYQPFRNIWSEQGVAFYSVEEFPNDVSSFDDEKVEYKHTMVVSFMERIEYSISESNGVVSTLTFTVESGSKDVQIDGDGITYP